VEGGDDFTELAALHENRPDKRQYLRVSFGFVVFRFHGVMLTQVRGRCLHVRKPTWSMGRCLVFNQPGPVPPVWVWTLADERAAEETT